MTSKYKGIDEREIKCCRNTENSIESGISFETTEDGDNILRFHFLDYEQHILIQRTKTMYLDKESTKQLINDLKQLKFK